MCESTTTNKKKIKEKNEKKGEIEDEFNWTRKIEYVSRNEDQGAGERIKHHESSRETIHEDDWKRKHSGEKRVEAVEDRNYLSPWEQAHDTILWNTQK